MDFGAPQSPKYAVICQWFLITWITAGYNTVYSIFHLVNTFVICLNRWPLCASIKALVWGSCAIGNQSEYDDWVFYFM